ncbi:hypothetical protein CBR_g20228 [Chara braunii]|uniref:Uncharacterized protein n=1 Tax=Chara braunii TaxID=69332 RepID=A0A388KZV9_CHABU|nr:hypothetical protein CBR_g20228 [Chara braunii]|eukprot:GBG75597.1 hypothetical protein CBR_g20228 [Chara braunii]
MEVVGCGAEVEEGGRRQRSRTVREEVGQFDAGFGKRKSTRQQTFEALTESMEKHGALVASTMEINSNRQCSIQIRQCEALEAEVEVQNKHYAASDEVSKLMCHALLEIAKAIREREGARAGGAAAAGEDDEALVNRVRQRSAQDGMEAASKLWVDDIRFWNEKEGNAIPPAVHRSIVLPHTTIPQHKIDDKSELNAVQERALKVQTIALRVIHGWVFKSTSRQRGYHTTYGYVLNHVEVDIARATWMGEDWRVCVSPIVFHITLDMDMKLPLWFVGANIKDRHKNDELAAYQEASIQRLVGAFTSAVNTAEGIDGGRVSHERLKSIAEAMRIMLAATMWLMRMSGDDHGTHYDVWVSV